MDKLFKKTHLRRFAFIVSILFIFSLNFFPAAPTQASYVPPTTITSSDIIATNVNDMIVYPHFGTPVFVEPGQTFVAELAASSSYGTSGWTAWVENDYQVWNCTVGTVEYGANKIYLDTRTGYRIPVTIPSNTSPELCTLVLQKGSKTWRAPMSVSVVPTLNTNFYTCAQTDTHMGKYPANGGNTIALLAKALTIAGVRYWTHTGDISLAPDCTREEGIEWNLVGRVIEGRVPFIVTAGNHEYDKFVEPGPSNNEGTRPGNFNYETNDRFFGMRSQIMKMGTFAAVKHDFGGYWTESAWLRDALSSKWNALTGVNYRVIYQHTHYHAQTTPMFQTSNPPHSPLPSPYPNLMIKGHDHQWRVNQTSPFLVLSCGYGLDKARVALFNFNYSGGNWSCPQATSSFGSGNSFTFDPNNTANSTKIAALRESFANNNNGTATSNTCTITNELNFNFYDGRTRFIMSPGTYTVSGGTILSQYPSADNTKTIVLVRVNIPASGTKTVSISQAAPPTPTPTPTPPATPTPSAPPIADYAVNDYFDDTATGSLPANWSAVTSGGTVQVVEVPSAANKSLRLHKTSAPNSAMGTRTFGPISGKVVFETRVKTDEASSGWKAAPYIKDSSGTDALGIAFNAGQIRAVHTSSQTTLLQNFTAGQWYNIKIVADTNTKTFDVYIDGEKKASQLGFINSSVSNLGRVMFNEGTDTTGTVYVNYLKVAQQPSILSQNFNSIPTGGMPSGWQHPGSSAVGVDNVPSASNKSLKVTKAQGEAGAYASIKFGTLNGKISFSFKAMTTAKQSWKSIYLKDMHSNDAVCFAFAESYIRVYNGSTLTSLVPFTENTWYNFAAEIDTGLGTFDAYVNGVKYGPYAIKGGRLNVAELMIGIGGGADYGTVYVDDVDITIQPRILAQNFDSISTGGAPDDWSITKTNNYVSVVNDPGNGNKSLKLDTSVDTSNVRALYSFGKLKGVVTLETRMKTDEATSWKNAIYLKDNTGTSVFAVGFSSNKISALDGDVSRNVVENMVPGTWYTIKIVLNVDTNKYDMYVNGQLAAQNYTFYRSTGHIASYDCSINGEQNLTIYSDYIWIY